MRKLSKISIFFDQRPLIGYVLVFILASLLFTYLALDPTFADPDSFYHAKMAVLLSENGAITQFPWLAFTTLKYNFVDHHFLYHLLLIPFVKIFTPLIGLKIATIIFSSLTILTIFWFLRQLKIKGAFWYVLFLLTVNPFIFRLNLAKAQGLALALIFIIIYLIISRRYLSLILACCLYVWLYGGWPLALLMVFVYGLVNCFWLVKEKGFVALVVGKLKSCYKSFLLLISVVFGILAGLFFSPYFPQNLYFYWQQSFKIAVFNYQYLIGVGGEWYPYPLLDLFLAAAPFFILVGLAVLSFTTLYRKQSMNAWYFFILSLLFFALTLKSRRYVEYFIPFTLCFLALGLKPFFEILVEKLSLLFPRRYVILLPLVMLLIFSPIFYRDLKSIKDSYRQAFKFNKFQAASEWLKQNSSIGDLVFHTDWDEFPILFYHNDKNYYLVGLDPTFMYVYDKNLYQRWLDLVVGRSNHDLYPTIKGLFGAKYVFVDNQQNTIFNQNLANNFYFTKVFEDDQATIYQVN